MMSVDAWNRKVVFVTGHADCRVRIRELAGPGLGSSWAPASARPQSMRTASFVPVDLLVIAEVRVLFQIEWPQLSSGRARSSIPGRGVPETALLMRRDRFLAECGIVLSASDRSELISRVCCEYDRWEVTCCLFPPHQISVKFRQYCNIDRQVFGTTTFPCSHPGKRTLEI